MRCFLVRVVSLVSLIECVPRYPSGRSPDLPTTTTIEFDLFEQNYRSHIIVTCLYHNMKYKTYIQLNNIYIHVHNDKYNDN